MNKLQTVYIPTKIEDELPKETCKVGIIINENFDFAYWMKVLGIFDHHRSGLNHKQKDITHWLKPTEGRFFTEEELKQLLEEYTTRIAENVTANHVECWGHKTGEIEIDKESILSQLEIFKKELEL